MRTKWRHFSFFSKSFQTKKKIKALRPKMTKIASRGGGGSCLKLLSHDQSLRLFDLMPVVVSTFFKSSNPGYYFLTGVGLIVVDDTTPISEQPSVLVPSTRPAPAQQTIERNSTQLHPSQNPMPTSCTCPLPEQQATTTAAESRGTKEEDKPTRAPRITANGPEVGMARKVSRMGYRRKSWHVHRHKHGERRSHSHEAGETIKVPCYTVFLNSNNHSNCG